MTCVTCTVTISSSSMLFCRDCRRSYDRMVAKDCTIAGTIIWTAERTRRMMNRVAKEKK